MTSDAFDTARPPPRAHPLEFKYALVGRGLERPDELVAVCAAPDQLRALWDAVGSTVPEAERADSAGLVAQNIGDAQRPVVMITLPAPERANEAYYLCAVPAAAHLDDRGSLFVPDPAGALQLRMFGMERSVLADGGLIGFVVEWTAMYRHNYDAPDDPSRAAFWKAILEIHAGTRKPVHSVIRGT